MFELHRHYILLTKYTELTQPAEIIQLADEFPNIIKQLSACACKISDKLYTYAHDSECPLMGQEIVISKTMKNYINAAANNRLLKTTITSYNKKFHEKIIKDIANLCDLAGEITCAPYRGLLALLIAKYLFDISDVIEVIEFEPLILLGNPDKIDLSNRDTVRSKITNYLGAIGFSKNITKICDNIMPV